MAYFLETEERQQITRIIANLYQVTDGGAQGRRVLLWQSGLQKFVAGQSLSQTAELFAAGVVATLENHGNLEERPAYHALGALLSTVLELPELSAGNRKYIAAVIVKYSLVVDPVYLERKRMEFGLAEAAPGFATIDAPPPPAAVPRTEPSFPVDKPGLERIIHSEDNFLNIDLLASAVLAAQAVCRIEAPEGQPRGTGFLIGPNLVLTNQHVITSKEDVPSVVARFEYWEDARGVAQKGSTFTCDATFPYADSPPEKLDYALLRLTKAPLEEFVPSGAWEDLPPIELIRRRRHRGYLILSPRRVTNNERVNIIQHPLGHPLKAVVTENRVTAVTDTRLQYVADTDEGSSGSPVFDQNWSVVALHHSGQPFPPSNPGAAIKRYWKGDFRVNEGIPVSAILKDFAQQGLAALLPR